MDVEWGLDTASGKVQFTLRKAALGHKKKKSPKKKLLLAEGLIESGWINLLWTFKMLWGRKYQITVVKRKPKKKKKKISTILQLWGQKSLWVPAHHLWIHVLATLWNRLSEAGPCHAGSFWDVSMMNLALLLTHNRSLHLPVDSTFGYFVSHMWLGAWWCSAISHPLICPF